MRAALTAIGVTAVVASVLSAVILELVHAQIAEPPGGGPPPWFPEFTVMPYAVGAFLALGLGRWPALAAVTAVAGIGAAMQLWNIALWAVGPQNYLVTDLTKTEIPRHLWPFAGVLLGSALYAVSPRPRFAANGLLAAVGISLVASAVFGFLFTMWWDVLCYSPSGLARCDSYAWSALSHLVIGVLLGIVLPRTAPLLGALAVLAALALPSAVIVAFQWRFADPPFGVFALGGGVLASIVAGVIFVARRIRDGTTGHMTAERAPA